MIRSYKSSVNAGITKELEKNEKPSLTVPDDALSVRQLLVRHAAGTLPPVGRQGEFTEDLPDLRGLDISEIHEWKQNAKENFKNLEDDYKKNLKPKGKHKNSAIPEAEVVSESDE